MEVERPVQVLNGANPRAHWDKYVYSVSHRVPHNACFLTYDIVSIHMVLCLGLKKKVGPKVIVA